MFFQGSFAANIRDAFAVMAMVVAMGAGAGCNDMCRSVVVQSLDLVCGENMLEGEIHFDAAAPFETFLRQQCLPDAADERIADILEQVDFSESAVWLSGRRNAIDATRCLRSRKVNTVQVCASGLKIAFEDQFENAEAPCEGRWTVAFLIAREDLRAALDAAE